MNKTHSIVMALAFAAVLTLSAMPASAASSEEYNVPFGVTLTYIVDGPEPWLVQSEGVAEIVDVRSIGGGEYEADVKCNSGLVCKGMIHA